MVKGRSGDDPDVPARPGEDAAGSRRGGRRLVSLTASHYRGGGYVERGHGVEHRHGDSSLADVVDLILDKGMVIDIFVRVSLLGLEILTIDIRIVVASVDTFLQFAEATRRLDLYSGERRARSLPTTGQMITGESAEGEDQE
jgi:gas vesicle structural protein